MLFEKPLHILISQSGNKMIGHCLDYDLVTSADTHHEALRRVVFISGAHVKHGSSAAMKHRAPEQYWKKFEHLASELRHERIAGVECEVAGATSINALQ
jgi:hypothetical protein